MTEQTERRIEKGQLTDDDMAVHTSRAMREVALVIDIVLTQVRAGKKWHAIEIARGAALDEPLVCDLFDWMVDLAFSQDPSALIRGDVKAIDGAELVFKALAIMAELIYCAVRRPGMYPDEIAKRTGVAMGITLRLAQVLVKHGVLAWQD